MSVLSRYRNSVDPARPSPGRRIAAGLLAITLGAVGLVPLTAAPAVAASNPPGTLIRAANTFYAYVGPGETLDVRFQQEAPVGFAASTVTVEGPGFAAQTCAVPTTATLGYACEWDDLTSATPGIWAVTYTPGRYVSWEIDVQNAGVDIPGRVWSEGYGVAQRAVPDTDILEGEDITLWYQAITGDQYRATYLDFNGIDSVFSANPIGLRQPPSCDPVYQSGQYYGPLDDGLRGADSSCAAQYKIFFEEPAADLPSEATRFDGASDWLMNPVIDPELSNATFTPTSGTTQAGTITFDVSNFNGNMAIQVDANGNGSFDDPEDRTFPYVASTGSHTFTFDGIDGLGQPIPASQSVTVRTLIDRTGEIHFVNGDVELRRGGIEVVSTRGPDAGNATVYWDDTAISENQSERCTGATGPISAPNGVDSTGGVHGWDYCGATASSPNDGVGGSYGDTRYIQEWTYRTVDEALDVQVPARNPDIVVTKSADPESGTVVEPGQVIDYTITFENVGDADGTVDYDDVLTGVLDDAALTSAPATSDDALTASPVTDGRFEVDGTLTAGQIVTVDYSVTVLPHGERGDSILANFVVPGGEEPPTDCVEGSTLCTEHAVPQVEITKSSNADENTRVGDTVTYSVTATNVGGVVYTSEEPLFLSDDLTDVLDDADYNLDATADRPGTIDYSAPKVSWNGALGLDDSVTLTYTVTVSGGGDGIARNIAYLGTPDTSTPECDPPVDGVDPETGVPCAEDEFELPRLTIDKSANTTELPGSGETVTYEVTVTNVGPGIYTADAPAVATDDLSEVLDDAQFGEILAPATGASFDAETESLTWSGPLGVDESVTISYTVTYDATIGDNILYNVACVPSGEVAPGTEACADVQIPAAALRVGKSVDPANGTSVGAGQLVTYTLTFENRGTATATVDRTDDLSDVVDDATLEVDSVESSSPDLVLDLQGDQLGVTGSVPAGETYTVTYSVTVNAFADQGNHLLANVVQDPDGCPPAGCPETSNPIRHFSVTKSATPTQGVETGDVVEYTITVTNDGEADYTSALRAGVSDDLSDVLDDARLTGDLAAVASDGSTIPAPVYDAPVLSWSGPLAVGESVSITYSVTVTNQGDADLRNTATPVCAPEEICDPETPVVEVLLPRITPEKGSDPASGEDVVAGQVITYTLTFTNSGQAEGMIATTDDLSSVLDDADLTALPLTDVAEVTAVYDASARSIRVDGPLAPGAVVTVTYAVTVNSDGDRGDNVLRNVATPDVPPYVCDPADSECDPFTPPSTEHYVGELRDGKSVDPASGTTVRAGQDVTYTLRFENVGEAPITVDRVDDLSQVLDDATLATAPRSSDPALSASEVEDGRFGIEGTLAPGQQVTVTYTVTVNDDGARGDDRLANYLLDPGAPTPDECVPTDDEWADCTVNAVSDVVVTKSSNPASGTLVQAGDRVVYTLMFRNVSQNPAADAVDIDYTDHLAGVLDDARLDGDPTVSSDAVTATVSAESMRVVGAIAAGQTVTVVYAVTVSAWDDQTNHRLDNVVAVTGMEPVCAPDNGLCTRHPVDDPGELANTGGSLAWGAALVGSVLVIAGFGLLVARPRRRRTATLG